MPPSSNHQYKSFVRHGKIIHVCSPELVAFKNEMKDWSNFNRGWLKRAKADFQGHPLFIKTFFYFERSRVLTKNGKMKKLDVSNRLKALHDAFAGAIGIDDSQFVRIYASKSVASIEKVDIEIGVSE